MWIAPWLGLAVAGWWIGATAAAVRRDVLLLESGHAESDAYALIALLTRFRDEPVLLALRCRISRGFSAACLPLGLAGAVSSLHGAWILLAALLGWLLGATVEASAGGGLARRLGRARGGLGYAIWGRLLQPLARVLRLLLRVRLHREERSGPVRVLAESQASRAAAGSELGREERRFLRRILASTGILVADILTRWDAVRWIRSGTSVADAVAAIRDSGHSRLPVVAEGRVVGVVNVKDLLAANGSRAATLPLRPAYFVRQEVTVRALLEELREARAHLTVVVDRLGRMVGIVTMEDVLEEIVGELHDEREAPAR
jgi:CBS domain-containing protein